MCLCKFNYRIKNFEGPYIFCRNDAIFENKQSYFLQVIYRTTHWLRTWATLQQPTSQEALVAASRWLERVANDFFTQAHRWRSSLRIESH